jgi:hypothetical protein
MGGREENGWQRMRLMAKRETRSGKERWMDSKG